MPRADRLYVIEYCPGCGGQLRRGAKIHDDDCPNRDRTYTIEHYVVSKAELDRIGAERHAAR